MNQIGDPELDLNEPIPPRARGVLIPLSEEQQPYWDAIAPHRARVPRMRALAVRMLGKLDVAAMKDSIEMLVQHHESLRTKIIVVEGSPQQSIQKTCGRGLEIVEISQETSVNHEKRARDIASEFLSEKIDVSVDPLFASLLLRLSKDDHVLVVSLEHIVGDGASCSILNRDLWSIYGCISRGASSSLPYMPIQFGDFAVWQQRTHHARRLKHEAYWKSRLSGGPRTEVPREADAKRFDGLVTGVLNIPLGKALSDSLRQVAQRERTMLPIVVLALYAVVVSSWCGHAEIGMRFVSHRRHQRLELQNLVGFLAASLYFRIEIGKFENLLDVLRRAHCEFLAATSHQEFLPPPTPENQPEVMFNWGGLVSYSARWSVQQQRSPVGDVRVQPFGLEVEEAFERFIPSFSDTPSGVVLTVRYRRDVLTRESILSVGQSLRLVGERLVEHPFDPVGSLLLKWK